ncbi:FAD-dependent oxidoreductase [Paraburkholderia sediminicola]|uniref:FAD-dependent oxidoreductase n=1 Tax=Paraburkholderia sediminicola TaxID=458836 RepID=UPI0038BDE38C
MSAEVLECDLIVVGAGMAGMSAAGRAAENGARVVVIEKAAHIGGSAVMSGGILWTASSAEKMALYGGGDPVLGEAVRRHYPAAVAWLRKRGNVVSRAMKVLHGYGYQIDIVKHLNDCQDAVEQGGGHVVYETSVAHLLRGPLGGVVGVRADHIDGSVDVVAPSTILATGGYQGDADLRARYIHENARGLLLRANPHSCGEGIALGVAVGAHMAGKSRGFYGHLMSKTPVWGEERFFTMLAQYHSEYGLLFNEQGVRFCDESTGDHNNSYHTVFQSNARALLLWDRRVHERYATVSTIPGQPGIDKFAVAIEHGGEGAICPDLSALIWFADAHEFNGSQLVDTLKEYNAKAIHAWETVDPPRTESCRPLDKPEFYALIVRPAITFAFGGLSIDAYARALDIHGAPIPGLLAAGGDVGDVYGVGYSGGLALAMTLGMLAANTAGW